MLELGGIIVLGILAQWVAWRIKVPAILPLILIGLAVGPLSTIWTADGMKLLEPIWTGKGGVFAGDHLFHFVELAIGIILFEGGMSLKREELEGVGPSIINLITLGSLVTFIGAAVVAHYIMALPWDISFLFSGLIIVTGPTVIGPILRNLPVRRNISSILKWEGILIDPIGALVAVLVYEFIHVMHSPEVNMTNNPVQQILLIAAVGISLGAGAAYLFKFLLKKHLVPHYLLTVFTLAFVVSVFVGSYHIVHDSQLLTIVVFGMVAGNIDLPHKNEIIYFGESLSILLISVLFILLAANINIEDLQLLLDWRVGVLFLLVVFLIRPIGVFLSTRKSSLTTKEKAFISWVGPRGIVAAGIASLFGSKLVVDGVEGAEYITPLVFMIVLGTVILNATTARFVAGMLGILLAKSNGILMIGAHRASRLIAKYLHDNGQRVVLVDSNAGNVEKAQELGLDSFETNIYSDDLRNSTELNDVGIIMAMTGSADVNEYTLDNFSKDFGEQGAYRLSSMNELQNPDQNSDTLFSNQDDYINLSEVARDYPNMNEVEIQSAEKLQDLLAEINKQDKSIPLFIKSKETNGFKVILSDMSQNSAEDGDTLVYMGKEIAQETTPEE